MSEDEVAANIAIIVDLMRSLLSSLMSYRISTREHEMSILWTKRRLWMKIKLNKDLALMKIKLNKGLAL